MHTSLDLLLPMTFSQWVRAYSSPASVWSQAQISGSRLKLTKGTKHRHSNKQARAGATYVSPFVGRLDDVGQEGINLISEVAEIFAAHAIETEIISASIRNPIHVTSSALAGAHIATVPYKVIEQMTKHPLTDAGIAKFLKDWESVPNK